MFKIVMRRVFLQLMFLSCLGLVVLIPSLGSADSGTFPGGEPLHSIKSVSYKLTGATLTTYEDRMSGFIGRTCQGTAQPGNLILETTITTTEDFWKGRYQVYLSVGLDYKYFPGENDWVPMGKDGTFESYISMQIPAEITDNIKTYGAHFEIRVIVDDYWNEKFECHDDGGFTISGNLAISSEPSGNHPPAVSLSYTPDQPRVDDPVNFTVSASDPDGDALTYAWYMNGILQSGASSDFVRWAQPSVGTYTMKVVVTDAKGASSEDSVTFTVVNSADTPYVIAPGYNDGNIPAWGFVDKVFIDGKEVSGVENKMLYDGSRIKTGAGVEILIMSSFGAVTRVKENTTYEVGVRKVSSANNSILDVGGRLINGICDFYWPPGHTGAEHFEVSTNRVVTSIKGTTFTVSHINDVSVVTVEKGEVEVTNLDTGSVSRVAAGQQLEVAVTGEYVSGPYNYYVPFYTAADGNWTGLGLANDSSDRAALVQYQVYDRSGTLQYSGKKLIPAGAQDSLSVKGGELDGWMLINSYQPLSGLAFIGFAGTTALMGDIPFVAELESDLVIPHVAQDADWDTSIMLCNPHNQDCDVLLELIDQQGIVQGFELETIPAMGSGEYLLASLFSEASNKNGKVVISADFGIAGFALYKNGKSGGTYLAGISAESEDSYLRLSNFGFSYYLPFFTTENGNWTGLGLANSDDYSESIVSITVFNEIGTVATGSSVIIPKSGQFAFSLTPPNVTRGWIQVDSDSPLEGLAFIGMSGYPALMADIPFVDTTSYHMVVPHVAQDQNWETTLLLCNPGLSAASIRIDNINQLGQIAGSAERVIAAQGSAGYTLNTLFPDLSEVGGKLEISSTCGLAGFALYSNKKSGGSYFAGINVEPLE